MSKASGTPQERGERSGRGVDAVGQVETRGVDYIPAEERHGGPLELISIWVSANAYFGILVIGSLPVIFGLSWWASFWALVLGALVGSAFVAPMAVFAPRTGTTNIFTSRAHFGIVGSLVSAIIAIAVALFAYALAIWTGGQAVATGAAFLFHTPTTGVALAICMALVAVATVALAIWGHATVVKVANWIGPVTFLVIVGLIFVLLPRFKAEYPGGELLLGDFRSTWLLAFATGASMPVSYSIFAGDYSRYFPESVSRTRVAGASFLGLFVGIGVPLTVGAYAMTLFSDLTTPFVIGLPDVVPTWYVVPLLVLGIIGTQPQGTLALYSGGLSLQATGSRLRRVPTTILLAVVGIATVFLGAFVFDAINSINAFLLLILLFVCPFTSIMIIGFVQRRGWYSAIELQPAPTERHASAYWFTRGYNFRALAALIVGAGLGFLFANTSVYVGPLAATAGGIDVSYAVAAVAGGVLYWGLVRIFPESAAALQPRHTAAAPLGGVEADLLPGGPVSKTLGSVEGG
jgi:purine-cytosine permease-like protein